jgi:hypothetical protein
MRNLLILLITGALLAACGSGQEATIPATTATPSAVPATELPGVTVTATLMSTRPPAAPTSPPTATIVPDVYDLATPTTLPASANGTPEDVVTTAHTALADHLGMAAEALTLTTAREQTWNSSALGCPDPARGYGQAMVPGYLLVFSDGEQQYAVHTSETATPLILCRNGQPERLDSLELPE